MKPCDITKFIKFYKALDSANRQKTGRNLARLASFHLLSVFPPCFSFKFECQYVVSEMDKQNLIY